nr:helix-turn-helix domain-containing protein [uncultured Acetatifactor sp.]
MRNKKLIPFEVIEKAVAGEPEAVDAVLQHYTAHIKYLPMYKGHINDDTQDRLKAKLVEAILKFRFDR